MCSCACVCVRVHVCACVCVCVHAYMCMVGLVVVTLQVYVCTSVCMSVSFSTVNIPKGHLYSTLGSGINPLYVINEISTYFCILFMLFISIKCAALLLFNTVFVIYVRTSVYNKP